MKKKILIISGGISKERLISLDTGLQVAKELRKNSYNVKHNHQNCYLSSAYYIKKPKNSGDITFFDPKEAKQ